MGVIYKITNLVNGKIYIGQTRVTEPQRWQSHIWHAYNSPENDCIALCNAIKKYGRENFKREILEEIDDSEKLNEKEIYYIIQYDAMNPKIGYNICSGGDGHELYSSKQILELYQQYKSIVKVSKILGCNRDTISKRLRGMGIETHNTTILQYSLEGELINCYSSLSKAIKETGLKIAYPLPKHHFSQGFFWLYEKDKLDIGKIILNYKNLSSIVKPIQQFDLNCNYIQSFNSAAEASRNLNIDVSSIKAALNDKQNSAGGFLWFKPHSNSKSIEEKYKNYLLSSKCCAIEEIDLNENVIGLYPSAGFLERQLNWSYNCIKQVCDGKKTHTHGRIFRYANEDKRKLIEEGLR